MSAVHKVPSCQVGGTFPGDDIGWMEQMQLTDVLAQYMN
jgi:hypothetical protein